MAIALYLARNTVMVLLSVIELAMLLRAIFSWFDPTGETKLSMFLYMITEPLILPIRAICERLHLFEGFPLDIPFLLTMLALMLIESLLALL